MNKVINALVIILSVNFSLTIQAKNDVSNSQDHPLVQRYPDSTIKGYHYTDFDEYFIVTGSKEGSNSATPTKKVEGEIYTIIYETADHEDSLIKIFKNFQQAFLQAGLTELYTCTQETCGRGMPKEIFGKKSTTKRYVAADPWNMGNSTSYKFWNGVLKKDSKDIYVTLIVDSKNYGQFPTVITLDIVETTAMKTGLVTLNPDYINDQLTAQGRVVLSGIVFDTDSDILKESSNDALKAIADYLQRYPQAKVYIVGHTDNQGDYAHNLNLSQRRAHSVVNELVNRFQAEKSRLMSIGVADVSPVKSNQSDNNREHNRRVEMVLR